MSEPTRNERAKMPAPEPRALLPQTDRLSLAALKVDLDPLQMMLTCLSLARQVSQLRRAWMEAAHMAISAEYRCRFWRERMKQLERDKGELRWEIRQLQQQVQQLKGRLGEA